jgi:hypothetical protein
MKIPGNDELVQSTPEAHVRGSCSISSCQKVKLPGRRINCIDQSHVLSARDPTIGRDISDVECHEFHFAGFSDDRNMLADKHSA